jgi:hypothetical protein
MKLKQAVNFAILVCIPAWINSCSGFSTPPTATSINVETVVAATLAHYTLVAPTSTEFASPPPTATVNVDDLTTAPGELAGYTSVENLNLRTNPGTLFPVSRVMRKGTQLRILGRAPGGDWLYVMNDESIAGWVQPVFLDFGHDGPPLPVVEPKDVVLIRGRVLDGSGAPVSGIGFAVVQGSNRTDAYTDETGTFFAYMPPGVKGNWEVGFISVTCTSNTMDASCRCIPGKCGKPAPELTTVVMPQNIDLGFTWQ